MVGADITMFLELGDKTQRGKERFPFFCIARCLIFELVYSYFEKGCRIKCTRQSRKALWMVFSSLFFKEILKNGKRGHGRMFAWAKGK